MGRESVRKFLMRNSNAKFDILAFLGMIWSSLAESMQKKNVWKEQ